MIPPGADNHYWLLNSVTGWRAGAAPKPGLVESATHALTLQTLPGEAQSFAPELTDMTTCLAALACDDCGGVFVLDAAQARILRLDPRGPVRTIEAIGGLGSNPAQLRAPRGLGAARGRLVVADTGNHRIQVFSPAPYVLIQLWGRADATPGNANLEFHSPWGVAIDECGNVYVADRGNRRVQKATLDGTWLATLGAGALSDPTELAVSRHGILAVVDDAASSSGGSVQIFAPNAGAPTALPQTDQPRAVAFDADDNLYVATGRGLVFHYAPDAHTPGGYAYVGAGVTGLDTAAINLVWAPGKGLLAIFRNADGLGRRIWRIPPAASYVAQGSFTTEALDSGIESCSWDRVTLLASIPDRSNLKVEYLTSDDSDVGLVPNPNDGPPYTFVGDSSLLKCGNPICGDASCVDPSCQGVAFMPMTCLVQAQPGRYLRLRFTFTSGGQSTPSLSAVQVFFPRQSYLRYLPAVYQDHPASRDFLDRFLSIFQGLFDEFEGTIDSLWRLFNPDSTPPRYLEWLAAWLQLPLDPAWSVDKKREMLKKAARDDRVRGTLAGLLQSINDYTGISDDLAILEHFRLRQCLRHWPTLPTAGPLGGEARLWSRQFYQRLQVGEFSEVGAFSLTDKPEPAAEAADWGANEFSLFFPADPYDPDATAAQVGVVVARDKPAHTKANLVPVLPRFRVGVQATLGFDSRVGGYTHLVLCKHSRLGYDAIVACSPAQRDLELQGATLRPIAGVTTTLF
jgi:phage tail-like protein